MRLLIGVLVAGCAADDGAGSPAGSESTAAVDDDDDTTPGTSTSTTSPTSTSGTSTTTTEGSTSSADSSSSSEGSSGDTGSTYQCPPPEGSLCANGNSIIGGRVQLAADIDDDGTGNLVVLLNHTELGDGANGGVYHFSIQQNAVDLRAAPAEFQLDMCSNGEMWSEENCGYQLIVILDKNGNNGALNALPDPGEPSRAIPLDMSCNGPPPCFDVELDCVDGASCAAVEDSICGCNPTHTCGSPIVVC